MGRPADTTADPASRKDLAAFTSTLRGEMDQLRGMVRELLARPGAEGLPSPLPDLPEELREHYCRLIQNDVAEEIARELVAEAHDRLGDWRTKAGVPAPGSDQQPPPPEVVHALLVEMIERMLPPAEPVQLNEDGGPKCVAFVGPTGVGKTTTIAKLAAHFKLREGKRIGLITIDTYRIAAVEQLKVYADILNVPLVVVLTPDEMAGALGSMADRDLVLIDTSGRSQRDGPRLEELKVFLDAARGAGTDSRGGGVEAESAASRPKGRAPRNVARGPDGRFRSKNATRGVRRVLLEVQLVLSCTSHPAQLVEAAERFGALGVNRVVFTKLDEAVGLGVILNVIRRLNLQLSYLTTGQDVPDDIEVGYRRRIAELVLGRDEGKSSLSGRTDRAAPTVDQVA